MVSVGGAENFTSKQGLDSLVEKGLRLPDFVLRGETSVLLLLGLGVSAVGFIFCVNISDTQLNISQLQFYSLFYSLFYCLLPYRLNYALAETCMHIKHDLENSLSYNKKRHQG